MKRVRAAAALMERLRVAEATVGEDPYTLLKQPFLSISGHLLSVNGERVEAYEYASVAAAAGDGKNVSAGACLVKTPQGSTMMDWPGPPPVYKSGRVIVQYAGLNSGGHHASGEDTWPPVRRRLISRWP